MRPDPSPEEEKKMRLEKLEHKQHLIQVLSEADEAILITWDADEYMFTAHIMDVDPIRAIGAMEKFKQDIGHRLDQDYEVDDDHDGRGEHTHG